ncbi:hypothetical protein ROT00_06185 [Agromyces mediolanus]|uniref:hypothetical protein n=1 Tax=Agromyces mediolanus TaxID=41986 RepID=UPI003835FBC9
MDPYFPPPGAVPPTEWTPPTPPSRPAHGVGGGAIAAIAGGAAALFLVLSVPVGIAAATFGEELAVVLADSEATSWAGPEIDPVDRLQSGETLYTFPAALENYGDGRYGALCPASYVEGCWQSAVFTEADCGSVLVRLGFSNDPTALEPERMETIELRDVIAYDATPVVFGNDDYEYGWVADLVCQLTES